MTWEAQVESLNASPSCKFFMQVLWARPYQQSPSLLRVTISKSTNLQIFLMDCQTYPNDNHKCTISIGSYTELWVCDCPIKDSLVYQEFRISTMIPYQELEYLPCFLIRAYHVGVPVCITVYQSQHHGFRGLQTSVVLEYDIMSGASSQASPLMVVVLHVTQGYVICLMCSLLPRKIRKTCQVSSSHWLQPCKIPGGTDLLGTIWFGSSTTCHYKIVIRLQLVHSKFCTEKLGWLRRIAKAPHL